MANTNTNNTASATVITGRRTRLSYANLYEPKGFEGGQPMYSASLIIPKWFCGRFCNWISLPEN